MFYAGIFFLAMAVMAALMPQRIALAASDDRAIDQVRIDFNAAFNAGDSKALGRLIDPDGVWMPPGKPAIVGKDKVVALYGAYFKTLRYYFVFLNFYPYLNYPLFSFKISYSFLVIVT